MSKGILNIAVIITILFGSTAKLMASEDVYSPDLPSCAEAPEGALCLYDEESKQQEKKKMASGAGDDQKQIQNNQEFKSNPSPSKKSNSDSVLMLMGTSKAQGDALTTRPVIKIKTKDGFRDPSLANFRSPLSKAGI